MKDVVFTDNSKQIIAAFKVGQVKGMKAFTENVEQTIKKRIGKQGSPSNRSAPGQYPFRQTD